MTGETPPEGFIKPVNISCRACGNRHTARYLCDPLKAITDAMMEAAEAGDISVTEFAQRPPRANAREILGPGTVLCRQIKIYGAVVPWEAAGKPIVTMPALVFTGQDADGGTLPQWAFAGSPIELRALRDVCDRMVEIAIRRAEDEK